MSIPTKAFPGVRSDLLLAYAGMETDLIFNRKIDLPGFATYPLLETAEGQRLLASYMTDLIALARRAGAGVILESPTWVANVSRAAELGYDRQALRQINRRAIDSMAQIKSAHSDVEIVLSANVGPRDDAYLAQDQMTAEQAEDYHTEQISAFATTEADVISGYTLAYVSEAIGIIRAAGVHGLPVVISFTVETDGTLPSGMTLADAINETDAATDGCCAYFMINCAHPDHFEPVLSDAPWMRRIGGIVANASRCSHADLDGAETLDDGDPVELGQQLAALRRRFQHLKVLGGCCGTDMRHMEHIAAAYQM